MSLTNLAQIKGGLQLQADVQALLKSYDAAKVLTKVAKAVGEGEEAANYNVEELLAELKAKIDAIAGDGEEGDATSLASLALAIEALKDKKLKDMVRVEFGIASGVATLPENFDTLVPACDKTKALPVYTADNEVVFNEKGEQLTIVPETGALNGVPSEIDAEASAKAEDGKAVYKAKADFQAKIFPVGEWKLAELPTEALLDNNEMQLVAYKTALDKLVIDLTKDENLIAQVKELVGEQAVQAQLEAALADVNKAVAAKAEKTAVDELAGTVSDIDERVKAIEEVKDEAVSDKVAVTAPATEFTLSKKPNAKLVEAVINHLVYREGEDFTVDRDTQKVTWTLTAANDGFDIDADLTDAVRFNYFFKAAAAAPAVEPTPADPTPAPAAGKGWEVELNLPSGNTAYPLSEYLTAEQLADLTDENCIGPNGDGEGRKVRLYMGDVELAWNESCTTHNEEVEAALKAAGYGAMDFVFGSYELDEAEKILNFATGANGSKVKLVYRP
jgi:hypothetical protein